MVLNEENQSPDFEDKYYMPVDSLLKKSSKPKSFNVTRNQPTIV